MLRYIYRLPIKIGGIFLKSIANSSVISSSSISQNASIGKNCSIASSKITDNAKIGHHCKLYHASLLGDVSIDNHTAIWGPNINIIASHAAVNIGKYCSIGPNTFIISHNHDYSRISTSYQALKFVDQLTNESVHVKLVTIEHDVWIGNGSVILPGSKVGIGAILGAGSVVRGNIPPYSIVCGNPARIIKYRFPEHIRQFLLNSYWWDKSPSEIAEVNKTLESLLAEKL